MEPELHWSAARPEEVGLYPCTYSGDPDQFVFLKRIAASDLDGDYGLYRFLCTPDGKPWRLPEVREP